MKVIGGIALFFVGAATGAVVAWKLTKDKYNNVLEVVDYKPKEEETKTANGTALKPSLMEYYEQSKKKVDKIVKDEEYTEKNTDEKPESILKSTIYSISPAEFGELEDYNKTTLYLHADNVLTTEERDILSRSEVEDSVGIFYMDYIGLDEDEVAYIRNDVKKVDYEILVDHRKYHEAVREA